MNPGLPYPIPDDAVRNYLVTASFSEDQEILKTNYLTFFTSLFTKVKDELENCRGKLSENSTAQDLAKWWSGHLESRRTGLYKEVVDGAEKLLPRPRLKSEYPAGADHDIERPAAHAANGALEELMKELDRWAVSNVSDPIKFIIYFDEAHPLTAVAPTKDDKKTLYDLLCSCLNHFSKSSVVFIFLSTNSSLAQFAAPRALAKSARIVDGNSILIPPITETPFDCCDELMVKPGELKIKDISEISFMAKFGRPL